MYSSENAHGMLNFNAEIELWTRAGKFKLNLRKGIDIRKLDKLIGTYILQNYYEPLPLNISCSDVVIFNFTGK